MEARWRVQNCIYQKQYCGGMKQSKEYKLEEEIIPKGVLFMVPIQGRE